VEEPRRGTLGSLGGDEGVAVGTPDVSTMYSRPPPVVVVISRGFRGLSGVYENHAIA